MHSGRRAAGLPLLVLLSLLHEGPAPAGEVATQRELIVGVRQFRAARYDDALATFRHLQAARQVHEIDFYLGLTLHKLDRHEEALVAFRAARDAGLAEPLATYYEAVSCYRVGLLLRARRAFVSLVAGKALDPAGPAPLGPRLREGAQRFLEALDETPAPNEVRAQVVLDRAEALLPAAPAQALEWLEEAALLCGHLPAPQGRRLADRTRSLLLRVGGAPPSSLSSAAQALAGDLVRAAP